MTVTVHLPDLGQYTADDDLFAARMEQLAPVLRKELVERVETINATKATLLKKNEVACILADFDTAARINERQANAADETRKARGAAAPSCPHCGLVFSKPKAQCSSREACERRQAARAADPSYDPNAAKAPRAPREPKAPRERNAKGTVVNPKLVDIKRRIEERAAVKVAAEALANDVVKVPLIDSEAAIADDLFKSPLYRTGRAGAWLVIPKAELRHAVDVLTNSEMLLGVQVATMRKNGNDPDLVAGRSALHDATSSLLRSVLTLVTPTDGSQPMACSTCGDAVNPLEVFPGQICLACYTVTPEANRDLTADEPTAMWNGEADPA